MLCAVAVFANDEKKEVKLLSFFENGGTSFELAEDLDYAQIKYIDFNLKDMSCKAGEEGYILITAHAHTQKEMEDYGLCYYKQREDKEYASGVLKTPVIAVKKQNKARVVVADTMAVYSRQVINVKNGVYSTAMRVLINKEAPYEEIKITVYDLWDENANYSGMARAYRNHQLSFGGFKKITDRLTPELDYGTKSVYVRIRMGWKPVPTPVIDQTPENEPSMYVACTFKQVQQLMEAYYAAGMRNVEFCLVGWNISGHDGRWPQFFPVEEKLGGEKDLRELTARAKELGYLISGHSNIALAAPVANNFKFENMYMTKSGTRPFITAWAPGRSYVQCPKKAYEYAKEVYPKMKEIGFSGFNYIDEITCVSPKACYDPNHPLNPSEWADYWKKIFELSTQIFGATSSEGPNDYCLSKSDYTLYVTFSRKAQYDSWELFDKQVPFWQIVYHGIVLYNSKSQTINSPMIADKSNMLKSFEYGDRPTNYYFSKFKSDGRDWMGDKDFRCSNNEEIAEGVQYSLKQYEIFEKLNCLQKVLIENHTEIKPNVYRMKYEDGSVVIADYNILTLTFKIGENGKEEVIDLN